MISEVLSEGRENAITGKQICSLLNITPRDLTAAVERERRAGAAICANTSGKDGGYYLAANRDEMETYLHSLFRRGGNIMKTYRACKETMKNLPEREGTENG